MIIASELASSAENVDKLKMRINSESIKMIEENIDHYQKFLNR